MMVRIRIDGTDYEVKEGKNLLETCLGLGIYIPHFCYHAALGSVGACRLCAVKKFRSKDDTKGRIVMSCMESVCNGLIVSVNDKEAVAFRKAVIESLMLNHPHDCPVCDEGGECHLQDMTVMTGHNYRRYDFKKRTYRNQDLGPFIAHEMNRCIQCYRCVRFYNDYAGGGDLGVFGSYDHVYFGRHTDGPLECEFSGNLAEVCPTGVFTDKTSKRHYTRKWDLTNAPSVCVHCAVGCNIIAGERHGILRRIMSRYNGSVNGYFLCDRGRFGYEFVNEKTRIRKPSVRGEDGERSQEISGPELQNHLARTIHGTKKWIGIGSPRASVESNYALMKLVGEENFFHGISRKDHSLVKTAIEILERGSVYSPSLKDIERSDAILILGEDLTHTAPMTALAVRQASRNIEEGACRKSGIPLWHDYARREKTQDKKIAIFILSSGATKLDSLSAKVFRASPEKISETGFLIASMLSKKAPSVKTKDTTLHDLAKSIADALKTAKQPLIISGIHSGDQNVMHAAANIVQALSEHGIQAGLSLQFPECNSVGLGLMEGGTVEDLIEKKNTESPAGLIILENDLYKRIPEALAITIFEKYHPVIVLDHTKNRTTERADLVFPVGTFAESEGTLVSSEGRAQRYYRVFSPDDSMKESWRQIRYIKRILEKSDDTGWASFDEVWKEMSASIPVFAPLLNHMPDADFRIMNEKIRRQAIRYSGRTAISANIDVSESGRPKDPGSPLAFSMEGALEDPPSSLVSYYWVPGWNSYQAMNFYLDEPNGSLKGGDPGIRLFNGGGNKELSYFDPARSMKTKNSNEYIFVPVYHIFGSEELSSGSPSIAERTMQPLLLMNPSDCNKENLGADDIVRITLKETTIEAMVKMDDSLPDGVAGLSKGFPGMPFLDLPGAGTLTKKKY
jgi:NADH-quinone oxidoreductase subunit G